MHVAGVLEYSIFNLYNYNVWLSLIIGGTIMTMHSILEWES